jgi:hypothetical protein
MEEDKRRKEKRKEERIKEKNCNGKVGFPWAWTCLPGCAVGRSC